MSHTLRGSILSGGIVVRFSWHLSYVSEMPASVHRVFIISLNVVSLQMPSAKVSNWLPGSGLCERSIP